MLPKQNRRVLVAFRRRSERVPRLACRNETVPAIRAGSYGLISLTFAPEWGLCHFDRSRSLLALACFMR